MFNTFHIIGVWCILWGSIARSIRHHGDVFADDDNGDGDDGGDDGGNDGVDDGEDDDGDDGGDDGVDDVEDNDGDDGGDASSEPALLPPCAPQR